MWTAPFSPPARTVRANGVRLVSSAETLQIGSNYSADASYFQGSLDDFNLFSSVLTTDQIALVYQNRALQLNGGLPITTPVQVASGAVLDLNGLNQKVDSLADSGGGGGTVTTSVSGAYGTVTLVLAPAGTTTFSGTIQNGAGRSPWRSTAPGRRSLPAATPTWAARRSPTARCNWATARARTAPWPAASPTMPD